MRKTYRAMIVTAPGQLELVERPVPTPGLDEVLIAIEACGMCGADLSDIARVDPAGHKPRIPGHEVVGRIVALGELVLAIWRIDQRVVLGPSPKPLRISSSHLVGGEGSVIGSITGSPYESEKTLDFSVLTGVRPRIETFPLERATEALEKLTTGSATFRIVLTMR